MGVPVKPKSWAWGKNSLMAWWFSPNWERWHSSKMKTMRLSRSGSSCSLKVACRLFRLLVALAVFVQREAELLDGGDDDLVGVVVGEQTADEGVGVGVFLDAAFLEAVELLARLPVEVLAVHDEEAFVDVGVVLEQGGGLEGGERLAAAGGVPDVAVAAVLVDALDDVLDGVDLVRPHHQQLLLAGDEHHVAADRLAERAFGEERLGEAVEVGDLFVVRGRRTGRRAGSARRR